MTCIKAKGTTMETERYLGDGVYASFDGYQIWLDLRGQDDTTRIALEPAAFDALICFHEDMIRAAIALAQGETP